MTQSNVPEPFVARGDDMLKEGTPEGLSDSSASRSARFTMDSRLNPSRE